MEHLAEEVLRSAIQSLDPKRYAPPRLDPVDGQPTDAPPPPKTSPPAAPPYRFPEDGDWAFTQPVRSSAIPEVDAIRDQALSLGWREAQLYQNQADTPCAASGISRSPNSSISAGHPVTCGAARSTHFEPHH